MRTGRGNQNALRIFRWPVTLALLSLIGLIAALVGNGLYDLISWIALGLVLVIIVLAWLR